MKIIDIVKIVLLPALVLLFSCSTPDPEVSSAVSENASAESGQIESTERVGSGSGLILRSRIIADILYEALYAFDDNKLLRPAGDNAYDRYQEVLDVDPGNQVAIEGIKAIVVRYVELADAAMLIGKYDDAAGMLDRAASIDSASDGVFNGLARLEKARLNKIEFYELDPGSLSQQSAEVMVKLAEIAEIVRRSNTRVLITARTDEEGRWIYKIMREAVGGYRLRGDIFLGNVPGVQINSSGSVM